MGRRTGSRRKCRDQGAYRCAPKPAAGFHTFRASKIEGLQVRNAAGEKVGSVNDIVLDLHSGKVAYIAMSVGHIQWASASWPCR